MNTDINKIGIYFAYWTGEWDADYHYYIDKTAGLGFDILELCTGSLVQMSRNELRGLRDHADNAGISLTYCVGFPPQYDPSSLDEGVRKAGVAYAARTLEAIHEMGGKVFGGINYASWPVTFGDKAPDKPAHRNAALKSMKEIIKTAEEYDIDYCLEVVNRFEQFLINTAEEALDFVNDIGSPKAKLLLDTFHMNIEEDSIGKAVMTAGSKLGHLHIGENNRKTPGLGHIPWDEMMRAVDASGYKGAIVMEPFIRPGGEVGRDIKVWHDLSDGADEMSMDTGARAALEFIRNKRREAG
ncbi:MAG: sugar phosphate isomerase/epimerase [Eubacteriales bacterium]|nr:sugar phosphate isomerase/epimerase [Eubacteriales bacterium]